MPSWKRSPPNRSQNGDRRAHRRCPRSCPAVAAHDRLQAGHRLSRRRAQACAAARTELGGGRQNQRVRLGQCRRCGGGGRRRGDGDDLDRQGDRAGIGAGRDQALCRDVLPGARCRSRPPPAWRTAADAADRGALRQCARLERLGGSEVQGADRRRRSGDGHASGHGALLHDHSRSLRSRRHRGEPCARARALRCRRSTFSIWASR